MPTTNRRPTQKDIDLAFSMKANRPLRRFGRFLERIVLSNGFLPFLGGMFLTAYLILLLMAFSVPTPCSHYTLGDVAKGNEPVRCAPVESK